MKQVLLNIPEAYASAVMQYIGNIPNASIVNQTDIIINTDMLELLDNSSQTSINQCLTKEESNRILQEKYGL
jgi:hypothetical protein